MPIDFSLCDHIILIRAQYPYKVFDRSPLIDHFKSCPANWHQQVSALNWRDVSRQSGQVRPTLVLEAPCVAMCVIRKFDF